MPKSEITQQPDGQGEVDATQQKEFAPITTQEEFDKRISSRLKRQNREFEARNADALEKAAKWEEWQEQNKTDLQKAQEQVEALQGRISAYEARENESRWAHDIAAETGVPAEALRGSTEEEMRAHAESLKPYFAKQTAPVVQSDGFAPSAGGNRTTAQQFAAALDGLI